MASECSSKAAPGAGSFSTTAPIFVQAAERGHNTAPYPWKQILNALQSVLLCLGTQPQACSLVTFLPQFPSGPHLHTDSSGPHLCLGALPCRCLGPLAHHTHCPKPGLWGDTPTEGCWGRGQNGLELPGLHQTRLGASFSPTQFSTINRPPRENKYTRPGATYTESPGTAESLY